MAQLQDFAELIVQHATKDGALVVGDPKLSPLLVNPYFANLAAVGLIDAFRRIPDPRYIAVVKKWVSWFITHAGPRGLLPYDPAIVPNYRKEGSNDWIIDTGPNPPPYDSVDSYIATFFSVANAVSPYVLDDSAWRRQLNTFYAVALKLLARVIQTSGPTNDLALNLLAAQGQRLPVCYTEDNCEVWTALNLAAVHGVSIPGFDPARRAQATLKAIDSLLFNDRLTPFSRYVVGKSPAGAPLGEDPFLGPFSAARQAQLVAIFHLRWSTRLQALYDNMKRVAFPLEPVVINDPYPQKELDKLSEVVWWGKAATSMEDVHAPILVDIANRLLAYRLGNGGPWIAEYGHACTFFSRFPVAQGAPANSASERSPEGASGEPTHPDQRPSRRVPHASPARRSREQQNRSTARPQLGQDRKRGGGLQRRPAVVSARRLSTARYLREGVVRLGQAPSGRSRSVSRSVLCAPSMS